MPQLRREMFAIKTFNNFKDHQSLLFYELNNPPSVRLISRKSIFYNLDPDFDDVEQWRQLWKHNRPFNGEIISDPSEEVPGFNLPRKSWTILNRIRTGQGRCNHLLHEWGYKLDASCSCEPMSKPSRTY